MCLMFERLRVVLMSLVEELWPPALALEVVVMVAIVVVVSAFPIPLYFSLLRSLELLWLQFLLLLLHLCHHRVFERLGWLVELIVLWNL